MIAQEGIRAYRWLGVVGLCAVLGCNAPTPTGSITQAAVSTLGTYVAGDSVTVSYDNMSGANTDWIAIANAGAPDTSNLVSSWTFGALSGTKTFYGLPTGSYEARAYFNFYGTYSYTVRYRTSFTIGTLSGVTVTTDHSSYPVGGTVIGSWSGVASPSSQDLVVLAPSGSAASANLGGYYTGSAASGSQTFHPALVAGQSYVVRYKRSTTVVTESAPFVATAAVVDAGVDAAVDSGVDAAVDAAADTGPADTGTDVVDASCGPSVGLQCLGNDKFCCSGSCFDGICTATACNDGMNGIPCTTGSQCCGGVCYNGLCPSMSACQQEGNACSNSADCCGFQSNDPTVQWSCINGLCRYCSAVAGSACGYHLAGNGGCCGSLSCHNDPAFSLCQ